MKSVEFTSEMTTDEMGLPIPYGVKILSDGGFTFLNVRITDKGTWIGDVDNAGATALAASDRVNILKPK